MSEQSFYRRTISPGAPVWTWPIRGLLGLCEFGYAAAVAIRNERFARSGPRRTLDLPVVSVGNITVGGTGKTPFVIEVVRRLSRLNFTPAVISRGYGARSHESNDEEQLIRAHCPEAVLVANKDRAVGAEQAQRLFAADVIVLDDGFQHRQLGRSLDIVLVDASCPFGYGRLLPRGLLREPPEALRRAHLVVITRADQVTEAALDAVRQAIRKWVGDRPVIECIHRVTSVEGLDGTVENGSISGKRALVFAGIGHPEAFLTTVRSLGVDVVDTRWWPDHHRYGHGEVDAWLASFPETPRELLLTTEKDAVKLTDLREETASRVLVVKVEIDFLGDGGTILQDLLEQCVARSHART